MYRASWGSLQLLLVRTLNKYSTNKGHKVIMVRHNRLTYHHDQMT